MTPDQEASIERAESPAAKPALEKLATWVLKAMLFLTVVSVLRRLLLLAGLPPGERQPYFVDVLVPRLGFLLLYAATLFLLRRWRIAGAAVGTLLLGHHAFQTARAALALFGGHATVLATDVIVRGVLALLLGLAAVLLAWQGAVWVGIDRADGRPT